MGEFTPKKSRHEAGEISIKCGEMYLSTKQGMRLATSEVEKQALTTRGCHSWMLLLIKKLEPEIENRLMPG